MSTFVYEIMREPGDAVKGQLEAEDASSAATALLNQGYHILTLEDVDAPTAHRLRLSLGFFGGIKQRELVQFTRDIANLLKAGLPLSQALGTLSSRMTKSAWQSLLRGLRGRLEDGQKFSEALSNYPGVFDPMYINLVRAGEESGQLVEVLNRLSEVGESREEIRARVKMAMVYPAVMLTLGMVTVFVMLAFVIPMFSSVFDEMGQQLPLPTRILVGTSDFCQTWWWAITLALPFAAYGVVRYARSAKGGRNSDLLSLKMPLLGRLLKQTEIAAFSQTLATLLSNGVPIIQALGITASTLRNTIYGDSVRNMALAVRDGALLSDALAKESRFPDMVANIVAVGEQSGDLSETLQQLAEENEREVDRQVKVVMTLLEPTMIVLLGTIVGFIVLAMLLPIFNLGDTIQV
jgi:type II secretory pathway component PulF